MDHRDSECGYAIAEAASRLIGTPFRLNGRDPERGLDCVGLVHYALMAANITLRDFRGYGLRNLSIDRFIAAAEASGLSKSSGSIATGDVILTIPGPAQHHLLVVESSTAFIHAHAGLRHVVRTTSPIPWKIDSIWRPKPDKEGTNAQWPL